MESQAVVNLFVLLLVAVGCGYAAEKIKIPGGYLVGSLVGAAILGITRGNAHMPRETKFVIQVIAGAFIGCVMERSDLLRLPKIWKASLIMLAALLILNVICGLLIWNISELDILTSLMCVVPGGISDTPIIASDMGADGPKVAAMQIIRQILGISIFPSLIILYNKTLKINEKEGTGYSSKREKSKTNSLGSFLTTLLIASIFGGIGKISGIPSGVFPLSILSTLILKLKFDYAYIPRWPKQAAQILSGAYLGNTITNSEIANIHKLAIPLVVIIAGYTINCIITGAVIKKTCKFTTKESMLITTPAGASDMALISSDVGVKNTDVIILQVVRAVVVMAFFPQIMHGISKLLQQG